MDNVLQFPHGRPYDSDDDRETRLGCQWLLRHFTEADLIRLQELRPEQFGAVQSQIGFAQAGIWTFEDMMDEYAGYLKHWLRGAGIGQ